MEAVKIDGYALEFASDELKSDKEIVMEAVKQSSYALEDASNELKNDKEFMLELIDAKYLNLNSIKEINKNLLKDKDFCIELLDRDITIFKKIDELLLKDPEIIDCVINKFSEYECSKDYDLEDLKQYPEELKNALSSRDFDKEPLIKHNENENTNNNGFSK